MAFEQVDKEKSCIQPFNISGKSYDVLEVAEEGGLKNLLDNGLGKLYEDVFGGAPYNEVFQEGEVDEIFVDYLNQNGRIFVLTHFETKKPMAFMVGSPVGNKFDNISNMQPYLKGMKTAYLADDGVDVRLRRQGVSTYLKNVFFEACKKDGFEQVLLRTRVDNYAQISVVYKSGGSIIRGVDQSVSRNIKSGGVIQEPNKFFLFSFQDNAKPLTRLIENAAVVRNGGEDTIVVPEAQDSTLTDEEILAAYPAAVAVSADQSLKEKTDQLIYSGHMYIATPAA